MARADSGMRPGEFFERHIVHVADMHLGSCRDQGLGDDLTDTGSARRHQRAETRRCKLHLPLPSLPMPPRRSAAASCAPSVAKLSPKRPPVQQTLQ